MSNELENEFHKSIDSLCFSSEAKDRLCKKIQSAANGSERENTTMKKWTLPKIAAAAVAVLALSGGGAYAAGVITGSYTQVSTSDYKYDYSAIGKAMDQAGIQAYIPESFSVGYTYEAAAVLTTHDTDESGNVVNSYPDLSIVYKDASDNRLNLDLYDAANITDESTDPNATCEIDGITVYYDYIEYVCVPDKDYLDNTLDPEIRDRVYNEGHFGVMFDFAEEDYCAYSNICFQKDNVFYCIHVRDKELSAEELFTVANELICE